VFDHDDGVGARGDWRARHNFYGVTFVDDAGEGSSRANFSDELKSARDIGGMDGEPVAHGAIKGGIIAIGRDVFGENAELGFVESQRFDPWRGVVSTGFAQDSGAGFGKR